MGKRIYVLITCFSLAGLAVWGCSDVKNSTETKNAILKKDLLVAAEDSIPGVPSIVLSSDYWIDRVPNPDSALMTQKEIEQFNEENPVKGKFLLDVLKLPSSADGITIRKYLSGNADFINKASFYITGDIPLEQSERSKIAALTDTAGIPDTIDLKFAVMLAPTMGRSWPTFITLMEKPGDNEFDQNVVSEIDMGVPVAVLHTSADGLWAFIQTSMFLCWVPSNTIAIGDMKTIKQFIEAPSPLVALSERVVVYCSPEYRAAIGYLQMGKSLPIKTAGSEFYEVMVPGRGENGMLEIQAGYIKRNADISVGYLPYTYRNFYRQCFRLLGSRYGWGGMNGDRDCSRFLINVFDCFDIHLPRNSASQAKASKAVVPLEGLDRQTRLDFIKTLPWGICLFRMPGHIMIYLGEFENKPYAIHDFWAWFTPSGDGYEIVHRAARVAVTDLMLGEGSQRGAYIDRLTQITIIGNFDVKYPGNNQ